VGEVEVILIRVLVAAGVLGTFGVAASPAGGSDSDLTGTWEGLQVCDDVDGGVQQNFVTDDHVEISQQGDRLRLRRVTRDGAQALIYQGPVLELQGSTRSETMISVCGGTYEARETLRLRRVRTDADGSATFDAESLYESTDAPGLEGIQIFGTCKWAYERVSTADPRVPGC
jgi:hypothetical protein